MTTEYRFDAKLDLAMSLIIFSGAGIAVILPIILILLNTLYTIPNLDQLVIVCQVGGCIMLVIGFSYFICRKEM
ncbi:MAG: hypothetical protein ACFE9D_12305 [Promethearchaeota archaeon]